MPRAERGLTLLEVLGAIALLGILYTVLAGNAIGGLRSEGESRRRLEASLLADERMAEIELSLQSGAAPAPGSTSEERDDFTIETDVRAFEPPPPKVDPVATASEPHSLAARRAEARQKEAPSLFEAPSSPTAPSALRTIDVVVRWEEGTDAREVRRTTYALDSEAIDEVFAALEATGAKQPAAASDRGAAGAGGGKGRQAQQTLPEFRIPALDGSGEER